ncbi:mucin-like protein 1 [Coprinopsis cinerea AmutBmut pab1-1]|nr:mucin-like protein 1 [Coprinopsis cinerea AmutBmut pab1-1]
MSWFKRRRGPVRQGFKDGLQGIRNVFAGKKPPTDIDPVRRQFQPTGNSRRDIAQLKLAYLIQDDPELKKATLHIVDLAARVPPDNDKLMEVVNLSAQLLLRISNAVQSDVDAPEAGPLVAVFTGMLEDIEAKLASGICNWEDVEAHLSHQIAGFERSHGTVLGSCSSQPNARPSNSLTTLLGSASTILSILKDVAEIVPVDILKGVTATAYSLLTAVEQTRSNIEEMRQIAGIAADFVVSLTVLCADKPNQSSAQFKRCFKELEGNLVNIGGRCMEMSQKSVLSRFFHQGVHQGDIASLRIEMESAISKFQTETQMLLHFNLRVFCEVINTKLDQDAVKALPKSEYHSTRLEKYLAASRDDELEAILKWVDDLDHPVLWIHGAAGLGKSTLMQKVVDVLRHQGRLASSAFFVRKKNRDIVTTIQSVAQELANLHARAVPAVANAARTCNSTHHSILKYLQVYIIEPVRSLGLPYPLVLPLDALDEWDHHETFLRELKHVSSTSPFLKFLFTSRWLHSVERGLKGNIVKEMALPPVTEDVARRYFEARFSDVQGEARILLFNSIPQLAKLAKGLLVWAATVCNLILSDSYTRPPVHTLLERILQSGSGVDEDERLATLYREALLSILGPKARDVEVGMQILSHMVVLQEPVDIDTFTGLVDLPQYPQAVREIHKRLRILQIRGTFDANVIEPMSTRFHASFLDFLTSSTVGPSQSDMTTVPLAVDTAGAHLRSAKRCLSTLISIPAHSYPPSMPLPPAFLYSTKYWPFHLSHGTDRFQPLPPELEDLLGGLSNDITAWWAKRFVATVCAVEAEEMTEWEKQLAGERRSDILVKVARLVDQKHPIGEPTWWAWASSPWEVTVRLNECRGNIHLLIQLGDFYTPDLKVPARCATAAVHILKHCVAETASQDGSSLHSLASALYSSYSNTGSALDLDDAITFGRGALSHRSHPHPDRSDTLHHLAAYLSERFQKRDDPVDDDDAIAFGREALSLRPHPHPERSMALYNLAIHLGDRFRKRGNLIDIDDAIAFGRESLSLRPHPHPDRSETLHNLAVHLWERFRKQGDLVDIHEAITFGQEALSLRTHPHPDCSETLHNLTTHLGDRFRKQGDLVDIDNAITFGREALSLRPHPHPDRSETLYNLAVHLGDRFRKQGDLVDIDDAIAFGREALSLRPHPHPKRSAMLYILAVHLDDRFRKQGNLIDIDDAIAFGREALSLRPHPHPGRSETLHNLAVHLYERFKKQGDLTDIDNAITFGREALSLRPHPHPKRSAMLYILAIHLDDRFRKQGNLIDIDDAIAFGREALSLRPHPHPERSATLHNLAIHLRDRFRKQGNLTDIDDAIAFGREALSLLPHPHPDRSDTLYNLVLALMSRCRMTVSLPPLEEAISLCNEALSTIQPSNPYYDAFSQWLAGAQKLKSRHFDA